MIRNLFLSALTAALALLAWASARAGIGIERPYEEGLMITALRLRSPAFSPPGQLWSEHPPAAYLALRALAAGDGARTPRLRLAWLALFSFAFAGFCRIAEGERERPEGEGARVVGRWMLVFALFASPLILLGAARVTPDTVFLVLLWLDVSVVGRLLRQPTLATGAVAGILGGVLTLAHAYGWVCALAMTVSLVATLGRRAAGSARASVSLAAAGLPVALAADPTAFAARLRLLRNHYWSEPVVGDVSSMPLTNLWFSLTDVSFRHPWVPAAAQFVAAVLLIVVALRGRDTTSRWLARSVLLCPLILWAAERAVGGDVVVYHWLGWLGALAACALARGLKPAALAIASPLALCLIALPTLLAAVSPVRDRGEAVDRAAEAIRRRTTGDRVLVFGGPRAFVLLAPRLSDDLVRRSYVYLRTSYPSDRFVGKNLVPDDHRVTTGSWPSFAGRVVVVELEAAQQVVVPVGGWEVEGRSSFVHPATSIGQITIETRRREP